MARPTTSALDLFSFAKPILINMANRPDRLTDSLVELTAVAGRPVSVDVEAAVGDLRLIRPRTFDEPGGFSNCGFRSNLDAHLQAARWARATDQERVLILEDDLSFGESWPEHGPALLQQLACRPWDIASLGYLDVWGEAPAHQPGAGPHWVRFSGRVNGAHAYFLHHSGLDRWIAHLEAVACGLPGDDLQGPMASDGAINTFTWVNTDAVRLLAVPNLVGTRPTRSDITPGPVDRVPGLGRAAEYARGVRRRHGPKVTNFH